MRKRLVSLAVLSVLAFGFVPAHAGITTIRGFVTSFDDTPIVYNLNLPDAETNPAPWPVILIGHGWGGAGSTSTGGFIGALLAKGYAVLTWDARGFGQSGGEAWVDDPDHEVRDVSRLIDMLDARIDIAKEAAGDPLIGMRGGSYAGGIQLVTAAFDSRIDAIVPEITWNDLRYSLAPGGVLRTGFDEGLYATGLAGAQTGGLSLTATAGPQAGAYSADLHLIHAKTLALGYADQASADWFKARSLAGYGVSHPLAIPTLLQQGNTDALFNINEAVANFNHVRANGAPAKLMIYCGGHVACPTKTDPPEYVATGQGAYMDAAAVNWFDKHVKGLSVSTGSPVEYLTNDGVWQQASVGFEDIATSSVTASGSKTLVASTKTSIINGKQNILYATPSDPRDPGTLVIPTTLEGGAKIVGIPKITLEVGGIGAGVHLFVKLVDREYDQVIDLQEAAIRIEGLDPLYPETYTFDGVGVGYIVPAGHHVDVQISTSSGAMGEYRGAAIVNVDATVVIPTL